MKNKTEGYSMEQVPNSAIRKTILKAKRPILVMVSGTETYVRINKKDAIDLTLSFGIEGTVLNSELFLDVTSQF